MPNDNRANRVSNPRQIFDDMLIRFSKHRQFQLLCLREDGSSTLSKAGAHVAYHDLAHLVIESYFGFQNGFFGLVAQGYSLDWLVEPTVVRTLGKEAQCVEVLVRALGALSMGACQVDEYAPLVQEELGENCRELTDALSASVAGELLANYHLLLEQWRMLREGETLTLRFEFNRRTPSSIAR